MKILLILFAVIAIGIFFHMHHQKEIPKDEYATWKQEYSMNFLLEEDQYRRIIFYENKRKIDLENKMQASYLLGLNQFSALTQMEFEVMYLTRLYVDNSDSETVYTPIYNGDSVDWRDKGAVTGVKNQGNCGSCWAFGATGNLEGVNFIFSGGKLNSFSEQQLVDCSRKYGNQGCNGGLEYQGWEYVKEHGIATEEQYPYVAKDQKCKLDSGDYKVHGIEHVKKGDCNGVITFTNKQPTSVGVDASRWSSYKSGIFNNCGKNLNHSVLVVGYTDQFYIIKNSWGGNWGEKGYMRLALGNTCGVCDDASTSVA